jgi:hypothetical protein
MQGTFRYPDGSEYSGKIEKKSKSIKSKKNSFFDYYK